MAKLSLAVCLLLLVSLSVVYEVQGTFLLRHYLRKFPRRSREFRPFACQGMLKFVDVLELKCPLMPVYKNFFENLRSYMSFINSASGSTNYNVELKGKAEGLHRAIAAMSGKGSSTGDSNKVMDVLLSMGKTLGEQQRTSSTLFTFGQRRELIMSMAKWARVICQFVSTTAANNGNSIDVSSLGIDGIDVNVGSSSEPGGSVPNSGTPTGGSPNTGSGTPVGGSPYASSGTPTGGSPYAGSGTPTSPGGSPYTSSGTPTGGSPYPGSGTPAGGSPYAGSGTPAGGSPYAGSGTPAGGSSYKGSVDTGSTTATGGSATKTGTYANTNTNAGTTSNGGTYNSGNLGSTNGQDSTSSCTSSACSTGGGRYTGRTNTDSSYKGSLNYQGQSSSQHTNTGSS